MQDSDKDVLIASPAHFRYDGTVKLISGIPKLSNASDFQMLQADSCAGRGHFNTRQTVWAARLFSCSINVCRTNLVYFGCVFYLL